MREIYTKHPIIPYMETTIRETFQYGPINRNVTSCLTNELKRSGYKDSGLNMDDPDWNLFYKKLLCFRPRLIGAVAAHSALTGTLYSEKQSSGGMEAFHMLFFIGSAQDDLIDEITKEEFTVVTSTEEERRGYLWTKIFGKEKPFYNAAYLVFVNYLQESVLSPDQRGYIEQKTLAWYDFLLDQEADVIMRPLNDYDYAFCRNYREQQNGNIGAVLTALLNGDKCLDEEYQVLENIIPRLSFRTQIIDDIADTVEDLSLKRPSYAIGALHEFPEEMAVLEEYAANNSGAKIHPKLLQHLAPKTLDFLLEQYAMYGQELLDLGPSGKLLKIIGDNLFFKFPSVRDFVYKIAPDFANF